MTYLAKNLSTHCQKTPKLLRQNVPKTINLYYCDETKYVPEKPTKCHSKLAMKKQDIKRNDANIYKLYTYLHYKINLIYTNNSNYSINYKLYLHIHLYYKINLIYTNIFNYPINFKNRMPDDIHIIQSKFNEQKKAEEKPKNTDTLKSNLIYLSRSATKPLNFKFYLKNHIIPEKK